MTTCTSMVIFSFNERQSLLACWVGLDKAERLQSDVGNALAAQSPGVQYVLLVGQQLGHSKADNLCQYVDLSFFLSLKMMISILV